MEHYAYAEAVGQRPEAVVRRYFICLDTENWDVMRELWHQDAELRAVGARPRKGREEVIGYFSKLFLPWPQHTDLPTRLIVSDNSVVAEVTFTGTTPSGLDVTFDAIDVFDLEDGRIRRMSNWYDVSYARRVLSDDATAAEPAAEAEPSQLRG